MSNIEKFFALLEAAGAVTVDDGALLTDWEVEARTGDPDNQVVRFSWTDGECDYSDILTEGGIAAGVFDDEGQFVAENHEGEKTAIQFYMLERLSAPRGVDRPRCLVVVSGGVADPVSDPGVDVEVFDWDNYRAESRAGRLEMGLPPHFKDLAAPLGIPVQAV